MASTAEMNIKVGADVGGAVNGLKHVNNELAKTGDATKKTGKDFTGLSRVIQDLPFGFIGIQNNLTQLLPAAGAAGLAFSAIVSAITFAQTGLSNWTRGLSSSEKGISLNSEALIVMSKEIDDAKAKMEAFTTTLEFINKIGKIRLDVDFGKSLSTDLLNLEGISVGNRELGDKLRETRNIIIKNRDKIRSAFIGTLDSDQIGKFDSGLLDPEALTEKQKKLFDALTKNEDDFQKADTELIKNRQEQTIIHAQIEQQKIDITTEAGKKAEEARKKAIAAQKKLDAEEERRLLEHMKLMNNRLTEIGGGILKIPLMVDLARLQAINDPSKTIGDKITDEFVKTIKITPRVDIAPRAGKIEIDPLAEALEVAVNNALKNIGVEAFSTIGDAIAAGITGGNIQGVFEGLFSFIGGALQDLGKQMIALSPILAALKIAIKTLNPALLLPAGIGLVAIGGVLKNLKPKGFAMGGLAFGPTLGMVGEGIGTNRANPEVIAPLDKLKNFIGGSNGTQVFIPSLELSYNKLMIAFNRAGKYGGLTS